MKIKDIDRVKVEEYCDVCKGCKDCIYNLDNLVWSEKERLHIKKCREEDILIPETYFRCVLDLTEETIKVCKKYSLSPRKVDKLVKRILETEINV